MKCRNRIPGTTISGFADNKKKKKSRPTLDFFGLVVKLVIRDHLDVEKEVF